MRCAQIYDVYLRADIVRSHDCRSRQRRRSQSRAVASAAIPRPRSPRSTPPEAWAGAGAYERTRARGYSEILRTELIDVVEERAPIEIRHDCIEIALILLC